MKTIYANRINKSQVSSDAVIYWFRNCDEKLVAIVSYGTLSLDDTVLLLSARSHRFISYLDRIEEPSVKSGAIYYVCD